MSEHTTRLDSEGQKHDRYQSLLSGEIIGIVLGTGLALGAAGANAYVALALVLGAVVMHLAARASIHA